MNDTQRLDYLQSLLDEGEYTKKCILRQSSTGRGFRLHDHLDGVESVRGAIDDYYRENSE